MNGTSPHELHARHDHPGHPEEEDLRARSTRVSVGVERLQLRRLLRPAEGGEGPEPGGEPGVQHVRVLLQRAAAALRAGGRGPRAPRSSRRSPPPGSTRPGCGAPTRAAARCTSRGCSPASARRPSSKRSGWKRTRPVARRGQRRLGERLHLHEPLVREARLHHRVAAVAVRHRVRVLLHLLQQPLRRRSACTTARRASKRSSPRNASGTSSAMRGLGRHHVDARRARAAAPARSRSGRAPGVIFTAPVPNSGSTYSSATTGMRRPVSGSSTSAPTSAAVALVLRVHRHRRVAQHRLRAGGGHHQVGAPVRAGVGSPGALAPASPAGSAGGRASPASPPAPPPRRRAP